MKKNKNSKDWLIKQRKDTFFVKAKSEGYRSRSAFKLIEMNNKFNFLRKNSSILDLGSSPGGWSQVVSKKIKASKILAVDIKPMETLKNVTFINGNFQESFIEKKIFSFFNHKADLVLSDMAANTTGNKELDSYRTGELCINAMNLAIKILNKQGAFVSKLFMGSIFDEINGKAKNHFKNVVKYKPISSKKESKEIYIFCKGILKI